LGALEATKKMWTDGHGFDLASVVIDRGNFGTRGQLG